MEAPTTPPAAPALPADPDLAKLDNWFSYHVPGPDQRQKYEAIRAAARTLAELIVLECPPSADRSAALRDLRTAVMQANASIACGGR